MNWNGKKVLVTGAGGFIGSHLTEQLVQAGATTRALVRYNSAGAAGWLDHSGHRADVEVHFGDVRDPDAMRAAVKGTQVVFHLAALIGIPYSYEAPLSYVRTNVEGTLNVLQAARDFGVERLIQTSTSEVYGNAREFPISETHPLQGQSPYSASKIGADQMAYSFWASFGLPVVILRPFNTFGPRQSARAVIPTIISQALNGNEIRLGSTQPTRDLTFVSDTCAGFLLAAAAEKVEGEVIQLGTGRDVSVGFLAETVLKLLGRDLPIVEESARIRPAGSEIDRLLSSPERARQLLGWEPAHTLEAGLQETVEWLKRHRDLYRTDRYVV